MSTIIGLVSTFRLPLQYMRISRFLKLKVVIDEIKKPTKLLRNASLVGFLKANQQFIL